MLLASSYCQLACSTACIDWCSHLTELDPHFGVSTKTALCLSHTTTRPACALLGAAGTSHSCAIPGNFNEIKARTALVSPAQRTNCRAIIGAKQCALQCASSAPSAAPSSEPRVHQHGAAKYIPGGSSSQCRRRVDDSTATSCCGATFLSSVLQRPDLLRTAYSSCHPSWSHQQQRWPAQSLHPAKDAGRCLGEHGALFTLRFQLLATAVQSHPWRARVYKHLMSLSPHLIQAYWDTLSAP